MAILGDHPGSSNRNIVCEQTIARKMILASIIAQVLVPGWLVLSLVIQ